MAINNPYVPGDPFSYDLKWIVAKIKEHSTELDSLDEKIAIAVAQALDQHDPVYYENVDAMIAADPKPNSLAYIEGYYEAGDSGANLLLLTSDPNVVIAANYNIPISSTLWAIPIVLTPYVTPEMFGAKGDGTTNDQTAFETALKYDLEILCAKKTYLMTSIDVDVPCYIQGYSTTFKQDVTDQTFFTLSSDNIKISGITFDPQAGAQITRNIIVYADDVENVIFEDCHFLPQHFVSYEAVGAVHFKNGVNIQMIDCSLTGANAEGLVFDEGCFHCKVVGGEYYNNTDGSGIWIFKNTEYCSVTGAYLHGNAGCQIGVAGNSHTIENCLVVDGGSYGMTLGHAPDSYAIGCTVKGCTFTDNDTRAIVLQMAGTTGNIIKDCIITGRSTGTIPTTVMGVTSASGAVNFNVESCVISNCYYGVSLNNSVSVTNCTFTGNGYADVFSGGANSHLKIVGNHAYSSASLYRTSSALTTSVISDNMIESPTGSAIGLGATTNCTIANNVITNGTTMGIDIASGSKNQIIGNQIKSCGQRGFYVISSDVFIGNSSTDNSVTDYTIPNAVAKIGNVDTNGLVV